jgi:hypothetical protein
VARLTGKQRRFVSYYLGKANGNATEAARQAGYAWPEKLGPRLVGKSSIRDAINAKLDQIALTADEILAGLTDHATNSLDDFVRIDSKGRMTVDLRKAKKLGRIHTVKKLKRGKFGWEIELYDSQSALVHLGKYRGLFRDQGGVSDGQDDYEVDLGPPKDPAHNPDGSADGVLEQPS